MDNDTMVAGTPEEYLIRKGGAYYRPNAAGYTMNVAEAGRYSLEDAIRHSHPNGPDGPRDGIDYMPAPPARHQSGRTGAGEALREAALVDAVRGALECLGRPDGYLPDIGAPKTRALQRAFEAYEPHPTFKGY